MSKPLRLLLLYGLIAGGPLHAQVSRMFPQRARDSLAAAERRSPRARRDRQRNLDTLAAGRRRWAHANVTEYELQVHADCFCVYPRGDSIPPFPLLTIRQGVVVAQARGKSVAGMMDQTTTVDSLFAQIELDLRDSGRVVRRLVLDPRYGFPRDYSAESPGIPDVWLKIHVDSFAVTSTTSRSDLRRPTTIPAVGTWRGTSICLVHPSPCNDEIVVYRITQMRAADSLAIDARKVVQGVEQEMGVLGCRLAQAGGQLICVVPQGVWHFTVRMDSLTGDLRLPNNARYRDVRTIRAP